MTKPARARKTGKFVLLWIVRTTPLAGLRMVNVPLHLVRGLLGAAVIIASGLFLLLGRRR